jgi:hypothetical protein
MATQAGGFSPAKKYCESVCYGHSADGAAKLGQAIEYRWRAGVKGLPLSRDAYGSCEATKAEIATMSSLVSFSTTPFISGAHVPARSPVAIR